MPSFQHFFMMQHKYLSNSIHTARLLPIKKLFMMGNRELIEGDAGQRRNEN